MAKRSRTRYSIGKAFEDVVEAQISVLRPRPYLSRQYPKVEFPGGEPRVTGKAVPDYIMIWRGVPFVFDTKSTKNKGAFSLHSKFVHQFDFLREADRAGAFAFYFVEWRDSSYYEIFRIREEDEWPFRFKKGEGLVGSHAFGWAGILLSEIFRIRVEELAPY